ncbi:hypothetical protein T4D_6908 [Trichinella pseudospiralis]|uniref:Uncharacterized protein n=1 Tax=Trichinella pseudospiralis TaxID=6337 RepID=A0A0V1DMS6_TRIPS|nr:hypothetical protein T4D_6908 [Trichinella pseudospiralis]
MKALFSERSERQPVFKHFLKDGNTNKGVPVGDWTVSRAPGFKVLNSFS